MGRGGSAWPFGALVSASIGSTDGSHGANPGRKGRRYRAAGGVAALFGDRAMARRKRKRKKNGLGKKFIFLIGLALLVAGFLTRRMMPHPYDNVPPVAPIGQTSPAGQVGSAAKEEAPQSQAASPPARIADSSSGAAAVPSESSSSASAPVSSAPASGRSKSGGADENLTNSDRHALDDLLRRKVN